MIVTRSFQSCYDAIAKSKKIPPESLLQISELVKKERVNFSEFIVNQGLMPESELLEIYASHSSSETVDLRSMNIEKSIFARVPVKFAWYYRFVPLNIVGRRLTIAVSEIPEVHSLDEIRFGLGYELRTVFAPSKEIETALQENYGIAADTVDRIIARGDAPAIDDKYAALDESQDLESLADNASVIQLVNRIILDAYRKRASDIHIEPSRGNVRLRYRIDGVLQEARVSVEINPFLPAILSRIKLMANLNIVEKRLPQDGKAQVKVQDQTLDLRVSSIPTPLGESLVVRLLPSQMILRLDSLGMAHNDLDIYSQLIHRKHGIIFLTGPTGSGKSTTLYATLNTLKSVEKCILTIEDPVEYALDGITQIQVNNETGLTFGRGLRSMLRHDPDIMMVGEVRDLETADTAIRVALTGHLIFSTLHTNDAPSGVTRLLDIGVEPYLVSSSVVAFIGQRLIRTLCPNCKIRDANHLPGLHTRIAQELGSPVDPEIVIYKGVGCKECSHTGFNGRTAIHEIMIVSEPISDLINERAQSSKVKEVARKMGMTTLRQAGWLKVLEGTTTPHEIMESTEADLDLPAKDTNLKDQENTIDHDVPKETGLGLGTIKRMERSVFDEKRKYGRIHVRFKVSFEAEDLDGNSAGKKGADKAIYEGITDNMSAGGMALITEEILDIGDLLDLKIQVNENEVPVDCVGRVIRVNLLPPDKGKKSIRYIVAIHFLAIQSKDRWNFEDICKQGGKE